MPLIVACTSARGLVTAAVFSVTLKTAAPVSVSTTSETPSLSSLPTASVSGADRDLQSKSPQSPPAGGLVVLGVRPGQAGEILAARRPLLDGLGLGQDGVLVGGGEGQPDPAHLDLLGLLELGRVVLVVLIDLGVLDRDLFLEVVGPQDDVVGGALLGDLVGRRRSCRNGPGARPRAGVPGDLGLGRLGDEVLDLGRVVLLPVGLPDLVVGDEDAGRQDAGRPCR